MGKENRNDKQAALFSDELAMDKADGWHKNRKIWSRVKSAERCFLLEWSLEEEYCEVQRCDRKNGRLKTKNI